VILVLVGTPKFEIGRLLFTRGVNETLPMRDVAEALNRHIQGDWGDVCAEDRAANNRALKEGSRLLSVYHAANGTKFWIITEWDRSATTVLFPSEY
jgi:hypothetical protein